MTAKRWVTKKEAAAYLSTTPSTIDRWVAAGQIRKHTIKGTPSVRFDVNELDALVEGDQK